MSCSQKILTFDSLVLIGGTENNMSVPLFTGIRPPSPNFTGRRDVLDRLVRYFKSNTTHFLSRRHFLLFGMGGLGKTQSCLKFIEENFNR
jgi:Holliday junction resolvasome RuvABC ATP-dependent DNA helicase subunit